MDWRIYYDDNTQFSSDDGEWEAAPADGVICVVVRSERTGRHIFQGSDFYFKVPGTDKLAYADDLGAFLRKLGLVKFGLWTSDKLFESTLIKAQNDTDIPPRSATDALHDLPNIPKSIKSG